MLGTNPISVAFPAREEPPVIVDFATSAISFGTAETAIRNGQILPEGLMIDSEGRPTNLPRDVVEGGHCCRWVLIGYVAGTKVIA
jgi:delta1-piperideine-2-carboxylate reductase